MLPVFNILMPSIPIAVQLYSVRDDSAKDFPATIDAVAKIGYEAVEFAGYHNFSASQLKTFLDNSGLKCCGTHTGLESLKGDELARTAEFNLTMGNPYLIVPGVGQEYQGTRENALKLAAELAEASENAKALGVHVGYHNHMWEFAPLEDGSFALQILAENTPPEFLVQLDTGNAQEAGVDPIGFLNQWKERIVTPHLKPYVAEEAEFGRYYIGEDDSDWGAILGAIKSGGAAKYLIIEQERYPEPYTPLQCIERCLKNIRGLGK